jgi:hypothetical protein
MAAYSRKFGVADHASANDVPGFVAAEYPPHFEFGQEGVHLPCIGQTHAGNLACLGFVVSSRRQH